MSVYKAGISTGGDPYWLPFEEDHEWTLQGGYEAPVQAWTVPKAIATQIMTDIAGLTGAAAEVTLYLGDPDTPLTVQRVIVLGVTNADGPRATQKRRILLTDVRWYFTRAWMNLDVNLRRRVGDKRLVGDTLTTETPVDTIAYAPWSTNDGTAFTWYSLRDQVITYLSTARHGRPAVTFTMDFIPVIDAGGGDTILTPMSTDAPATVGLARAIESRPGASIYVALDGTIHIYDRTPGSENPVVASLPPDFMGHGSLVWVDNRKIRPAASAHSWRVYVDYEVECRFTYNFTGVGLFSTVTKQDPFLVPVLRVTDISLTIPAGTYPTLGTIGARTVGQGTWITLAEAFAAWGAKTFGPITLPQLTDDIVARHYFGDALQRYTIGGGVVTFDPIWSARINELLRCYRTYFRINPAFWDRIRHAWAVRAAIWDPATGTRAPSPVYSNFNLTPEDNWDSSQVKVFGIDKTDSYPEGAHEGLLAFANPSGFTAFLEDAELGIVGIDRDILRFPGHAALAPSPVQQAAAIDGGGVGLWDGARQKLVLATVPAGWKLATVLSCAPASPNDLRRMFEVQVSTVDAAAAAGLTGYSAAGDGPDIETRTQLAEARVAWRDGDSATIFELLGATDTHDTITTNEPYSQNTTPPAPVPINLNQELIPIAQAVAAADLLSKQDHWEGSKAIPMTDLAPLGSLDRVVHKVTRDRAITVVHCTPISPPFRAVDLLTGSARTFLLKEIASSR